MNHNYYNGPSPDDILNEQRRRRSLQIEAMYLIRNNGYNKFYLRPYVTNFTSAREQEIFRTAVDNFVRSSSVEDSCHFLNKELSDVISISNVPGQEAKIPNGWDTPRAQFIILCSYTPVNNLYKEMYIIQGYTSHIGFQPTHGGNLLFDDNMLFFCNSVISYSVNSFANDHTPSITSTQSYSILRDMDGANENRMVGADRYGYSNLSDDKYLLRPNDILSGIGDDIDADTGEFVINMSGQLSSNLEYSSLRSHGDPVNYLGGIVNAYKIGKNDSRLNFDGVSSLRSNSFESAAELHHKNSIANSRFFSMLLASNSEPTATVFSVSDLNIAFENFFRDGQNRIVVQDNQSIAQYGTFDPNNTVDVEYRKCLEILLTAVSIVSSHGVMEASIVFNLVGNLTTDAQIMKLESPIFIGSDAVYMTILKSVQRQIINRCLERYKGYDFDGCIQGEIFVDLTGDSVLTINYAPHIPIEQNTHIRTIGIPTFADSLISQVIGTRENKERIVTDLGHVLSESPFSE